MTCLVAWVGVDQRAPASIYFAADSRLYWPDGRRWDNGRKVFSTRTLPHLFAYCGEAVAPVHALSQLVDHIDSGLLLEPTTPATESFDAVREYLSSALASYPSSADFTFVHALRSGLGMSAAFHVVSTHFSARQFTAQASHAIPATSGLVEVWGSGASAFRRHHQRWQESDVGRTSRSVFSAFCDAVAEEAPPSVGGPPQLAGLTRRSPGETFGIVWQGRRYLYGTEVDDRSSYGLVRWRNELFEICNPSTLQPESGAQRQARPLSLRKG